MKFRPLHDRVVIRRLEGEDKTKGGIIIPDTVKEKPQEGEVVAVGPGARDESGKLQPLELKAGDRVLFGKWSGTEVKIDGQELLIMKESDIMGGWIPTRGATPSTALVPQQKVGFPIPNPRLLPGFQGTKTARREGISSPFSDAGGCTSRRNSGSRLVNANRTPLAMRGLEGTAKGAEAVSQGSRRPA